MGCRVLAHDRFESFNGWCLPRVRTSAFCAITLVMNDATPNPSIRPAGTRALARPLNGLASLLRAGVLAGLCLLTMSPVAHAAVTPDQAEQIMKKSGLWDQLGSVLPQARIGFSAAFSLNESEPTNEEADRLNTALEQAYGPQSLRQLGLKLISASVDAKQAAAMRRWFDSPLGRKVAQVEQAASNTQTDLREVIKQGTDVFAQLPAARRDLLTRLLQETKADEAMVNVSIHTLVATHRGVTLAIPGQSSLTNDEVKSTLMAERDAMIQSYRQLILASFAQAYAPLSDKELGAYVAFLHSTAGRRHTQLAFQSLQAALDEGARRFAVLAPAALEVSVEAAAPAAGTSAASAPQ